MKYVCRIVLHTFIKFFYRLKDFDLVKNAKILYFFGFHVHSQPILILFIYISRDPAWSTFLKHLAARAGSTPDRDSWQVKLRALLSASKNSPSPDMVVRAERTRTFSKKKMKCTILEEKCYLRTGLGPPGNPFWPGPLTFGRSVRWEIRPCMRIGAV